MGRGSAHVVDRTSARRGGCSGLLAMSIPRGPVGACFKLRDCFKNRFVIFLCFHTSNKTKVNTNTQIMICFCCSRVCFCSCGNKTKCKIDFERKTSELKISSKEHLGKDSPCAGAMPVNEREPTYTRVEWVVPRISMTTNPNLDDNQMTNNYTACRCIACRVRRYTLRMQALPPC